MTPPVLIIPGFGNSGPDHWQSLWDADDASMTRIRMDDWARPDCASWLAAIDALARESDVPVVVAHSVGCLAFARWFEGRRKPIRGALLVAVPDPTGTNFPPDAVGFAPVPMAAFPFRSIVVASADDPYGSPVFARSCAEAWGSEFVDIGRAGHINGASKLGFWPRGLAMLRELRNPTGNRT